ncbi:hypothetical protein WR25_06096 [Diploscapter pachys]|uniref:Lipid-binding serum glycoprotein C-terminal domain-containing protein n=1 Tax=Diploscapter pachys TaxID=2018661 RepID=A0A2A2M0A4_9BILA|nr:hypothetical protein WR25_06096 [Diploscapter pachys]
MFTWSMSKMHIRASGQFEASLNSPLLLPTVPITGHFEALLGHVALSLSVKFERSPLGAPFLRSLGCRSSVGYVDLNVRNTGLLTDFFINSFKSFLIGHFKPQVEQRMCQMIQRIVDADMNSLLATIPLKIRINEQRFDILRTSPIVFKSKPRSKLGQKVFSNVTMLLNYVSDLRNQDLLLDYSLLADPFIQSGAMAMMAKGEISWRGQSGTPFFPPNIRLPPPHGVHMAEFIASDYLANSLLYHAYKQSLIDLTIGPESSDALKDILVTTCTSGFCLGEFLGNLGEAYPNRQVEVQFRAKKAPIVVFVEDRARFRLHGHMNLFVRAINATTPAVLVVSSDSTITANIAMAIDANKVKGNATIDSLDFKLKDTKLQDVDANSFADLGLFGAEFLEKLLTQILQHGIVLPTMQGIQLKSPKLTFHERYLRVTTYFKLDEAYAYNLVRAAVRSTFNSVG